MNRRISDHEPGQECGTRVQQTNTCLLLAQSGHGDCALRCLLLGARLCLLLAMSTTAAKAIK